MACVAGAAPQPTGGAARRTSAECWAWCGVLCSMSPAALAADPYYDPYGAPAPCDDQRLRFIENTIETKNRLLSKINK
eukprot:3749825-Pyramimonas_sp.AAC.2